MAGMLPATRMADGVEATLHVVAAERVAQTTVSGFGLCEEYGEPLTQRQKVAFLTAALLELDGLHQELGGVLQVERLIAELRVERP